MGTNATEGKDEVSWEGNMVCSDVIRVSQEGFAEDVNFNLGLKYEEERTQQWVSCKDWGRRGKSWG